MCASCTLEVNPFTSPMNADYTERLGFGNFFRQKIGRNCQLFFAPLFHVKKFHANSLIRNTLVSRRSLCVLRRKVAGPGFKSTKPANAPVIFIAPPASTAM